MSLRRAVLVALPVIVLALSSCGSDDKTSTATTVPPAATTTAAAGTTAATTPAGGAATITVADFAFSPKELTVKAGTAVEIKNTQGVPHTFTADDASFDQELDPDGGATVTFAKAGSFPYFCEIHKTMTGTVTVES